MFQRLVASECEEEHQANMRRLWRFLLVISLAKTCWADVAFTDLPSGFFGGTSSGSYAYATAGKQRPCKSSACDPRTVSLWHMSLLIYTRCICCMGSCLFACCHDCLMFTVYVVHLTALCENQYKSCHTLEHASQHAVHYSASGCAKLSTFLTCMSCSSTGCHSSV